MDFATIGKIGTYVRQKNLTFAAKHKIQTGQSLTNANGNLRSLTTSTFDKLREAAKASTDQAKQQKLARIRQKLKAGQKLTDEELGFLRVNDPKTYKKAKHADEAREELKAELKKAKSKSEAREAMTRALVKASAEAMAELSALGQGGGAISAGGGGSADSSQGGLIASGGEVSGGVSGGEVSSSGVSADDANTSADGTEKQTLSEVNTSIQAAGERATDKLSESNAANHSDKSRAESSDDESFTREDILEKYLWTIRALQDEWAHFTNSDEYKRLPDTLADEASDKKINRNLLKAAATYRRAMNESINIA